MNNLSEVAQFPRSKKEIMPSFASGFIEEPRLIFGNQRECVDPKLGMLLHGPYHIKGSTKPHLNNINIGIVAPSSSISDAIRWMDRCKSEILNDGSHPELYPQFPGLNEDSTFSCNLNMSEAWNYQIPDKEIVRALKEDNTATKIRNVIDLFIDGIETISARDPKPNVILVCLPKDVVSECYAKANQIKKGVSKNNKSFKKKKNDPQMALPLGLDTENNSWLYENLRRGLKSESMPFGIPIQIVHPKTTSTEPENPQGVQDIATRAWNFCTGLYYKAGGIPWRMSDIDQSTCFVGISFYRDKLADGSSVRTSLAQAFSASGDGFVLRGEPFKWDSRNDGPSPHLTEESAYSLISSVVSHYKKQHKGSLPNRVVIHKTSRFTDEEYAGLERALEHVPNKDYIAFGRRNIQMYRTGDYPVLRGSYIKFSDTEFMLYTNGYIPFLRTYPGLRVPRPLDILDYKGDTPWLTMLREVLILSKLNWNSADFCFGYPITLSFSRKVGDVLSELPDRINPRPEFKFYI